MTLAPHDSQQPNHTEQLPDTSRTQEISLEMRSSNFWKILSRGCWQSAA